MKRLTAAHSEGTLTADPAGRMKTAFQSLAWGLALTSALALASAVALDLVVDTVHASERHSEHGTHSAQSSLPAAAQWATDAPLREGMTRMHQALTAAQPAGTTHALGTSEAIRLQQVIETNVSFLVANCKLPGPADEALHGLLGGLIEGAGALAEPATREHGVQRIRASLDQYPKLFSAPHWSEPAGLQQ